ncbi:MAG TPA: hypothetical protein VF529_13685 [Solirubrobacteraceae bacterium]|jgi:hypothetical protein
MHALPSHPRHPLVAGLVAALLGFTGLAATAPDLGTFDVSIGSGTSSTASTYVAPAGGTAPANRDWAHQPLRAPVDLLAGR